MLQQHQGKAAHNDLSTLFRIPQAFKISKKHKIVYWESAACMLTCSAGILPELPAMNGTGW